MSTDEQIDWVERRAQREKWLQIRGPQLWSDLKSAIERAVKSFQKHYSDWETTFGKANYADSIRLHARRRSRQDSRSLEIHYEVTERAVHGIFVNNCANPVVTIELESTEGQFTRDGKPITVDQASQLLLEPFLFPSEENREPT